MVVCFIIPPHILAEIARNGDQQEKEWAERSIKVSQDIREKRQEISEVISDKHLPKVDQPLAEKEKSETLKQAQGKNRLIYTANNSTTLPGTEIGSEGKPPSDVAGDQAYIGTGATYDLYLNSYKRNSINDRGMSLVSTVH